MPYSFFTKSGNVQSSEYDYLWVPSDQRPNTIGVIAAHGAATPAQYAGSGWPEANKLVSDIANAGIPVIAGYFGGDVYANDTHMARITSALSSLVARTGCRSDVVHLLGTSMGGGAIIRWAMQNKPKVASLAPCIPMVNPQRNHRTDNPTSIRAAIATAWGVTAPRVVTDAVTTAASTTISSAMAAFTAADVGRTISTPNFPYNTKVASQTGTAAVLSNPASASGSAQTLAIMTDLPSSADFISQASTLSGVPTRLYYSTADTLITPSDVTAMAAGIGSSAQAIVFDNAYGHANASFQTFDRAGYIAWLKSLGS